MIKNPGHLLVDDNLAVGTEHTVNVALKVVGPEVERPKLHEFEELIVEGGQKVLVLELEEECHDPVQLFERRSFLHPYLLY